MYSQISNSDILRYNEEDCVSQSVAGNKKSPHGSERRLRSAYGVQIMGLKCSETIRTVLVKPHQ